MASNTNQKRERFLITIPYMSADFDEVCKIQSVQPPDSGNYIAKLDGYLKGDFISQGYSRSVIIKSHGDNLSAGQFTVKGFQNGIPVTAGPFNGPASNGGVDTSSVTPNGIFDKITSIEVTDNLIGDDFSVGSGYSVISRPLFVNWSNPNTNFMAYGLSVRNPGEHSFEIYAAQVFNYGISLGTQISFPDIYGIFPINLTSNDSSYIYRGFEGPAPEGTSVSYPLWDAFFVVFDFSESETTSSAVVAFPQIGR